MFGKSLEHVTAHLCTDPQPPLTKRKINGSRGGLLSIIKGKKILYMNV